VIKLSATGVCALASSCNVAMEVGALGLGECGFQSEVLSRAASQPYAEVIDISRHGSAFLLFRLEPLH
jgi:hypothetical protein